MWQCQGSTGLTPPCLGAKFHHDVLDNFGEWVSVGRVFETYEIPWFIVHKLNWELNGLQ